MPLALNRAGAYVLGLAVLLAGCGTYRQKTSWVEELVSRLDCGMELSDVADLGDREIRPNRAKTELGTHRIDGEQADVWLGFEGGHLVTVTAGYIDGMTSIRRTPKENLCTGELTFIVTLEWTEEFQGSSIFWDEALLKKHAFSGFQFETSAGSHELRIEKAGHQPVVKRLNFGPRDRGDQQIEVGAREVHLRSDP